MSQYILYLILKLVVKSLKLVAITTTQVHWTKSELRFSAGANPTPDVLEIRDDENL